MLRPAVRRRSWTSFVATYRSLLSSSSAGRPDASSLGCATPAFDACRQPCLALVDDRLAAAGERRARQRDRALPPSFYGASTHRRSMISLTSASSTSVRARAVFGCSCRSRISAYAGVAEHSVYVAPSANIGSTPRQAIGPYLRWVRRQSPSALPRIVENTFEREPANQALSPRTLPPIFGVS